MKRLAIIGAAFLAIGCSEQQLTSPESAQTVGPAFSFQSSSSGRLFGTDGEGHNPSTLYTIDATTGGDELIHSSGGRMPEA